MKKNRFLFEELVKRDFKKKYKRTVLGMLWSLLAPLLNVLILMFVFVNIFGRTQEHFIIYIFCGTLVMSFYTEATQGCMRAIMANASIFTKINVPKYLFLFSKNVSALINFGIILVIYFGFVVFDGISFSWQFLLLIYPVICLIIMNIGIGLILSALYIFFKDIQYLYRLFTQVVMYGSAIFYSIDILPQHLQTVFYCNPIFVCITYFRSIVLYNTVPDLSMHLLLAAYAVALFAIGCWIYKKNNYKFLYYV